MEELHKKIEAKAYEYFIERGMTHGNDMGDWLKAEKEILKKTDDPVKNKISKFTSRKK